ncbi:hypothetical protein Dimus_038793 [Dionaea muscipula]
MQRTEVVTEETWGDYSGHPKIVKEILEPGEFCSGVRHGPIFGLGAGTRDDVLLLGTPGDKVLAEECAEAGSGAPGGRTTGPIGVRVRGEREVGFGSERESKIHCPFDVPHDPGEKL